MPGKEKLPLTIESLDKYISDLRAIAGGLGEVSRQMRADDVPEISVVGQRTADRGLGYFGTLLNSCKREMRNLNLARKRM